MPLRNLAEKAVSYILNFIGIPYIWGGDDPIAGMDCSGLVIEMLKSVGKISPNIDYSAEGLRQKYLNNLIGHGEVGVLVFFGKTKATHVGICLDNKLMIESGGGDSQTTSDKIASVKNAYIKMRPINNRKDLLCFCDPFEGDV